MKKRSDIWILLLIGIAVVLVAALLLWPRAAASDKSLGKCLAEKNVVMYGVDTCPHCLDQKNLFGEDFENVPYVNCAFKTELCREKGVVAYPYWMNGDDVLIGLQSLERLAEFSGCELPPS